LAVRENVGSAFTLEQLSDRTQLSTKTLTKVRRRQSPVDQPTLTQYFQAFGLSLEAEDYLSQDANQDGTAAKLINLLRSPLKGQLALDSPFYIYRPPAEKLLAQEIVQPGALVRIRAPKQFGKTSLIARGAAQAEEQGMRVAIVSLQLADSEIFASLNQFLRWLCVMVSRNLGLPNRLEELWQPLFGSSYSCNDYFESYLLPATETPLLLVLDEVNILFHYPEVATDFFGMLRAWYERSRHSTDGSELWQKLRLVILYSTEVFLPLNVHQSPFNVGLLISLPSFTQAQVQELVSRYNMTSSETYSEELIRLLDGNPYLTQLALFHLSQQHVTIATLLDRVTTPDSIFDSYLRQQLAYLEQNPPLKAAMQKVISSTNGVELYPPDAFRLQGLGLIRFQTQVAIASCTLHQTYFTQIFNQ
jgi:hypothetical protein